MKLLLVNACTGSGNEVFFDNLQMALGGFPDVEVMRLQMGAWDERIPGLALSKRHRNATFENQDVIVTNLELACQLRCRREQVCGIAHHNPSSPELLKLLPLPHRLYYRFLLGKFFWGGLRLCRHVVAPSRATLTELESRDPALESRRYHCIYHGIDTDFFSPDPEVKRLRGRRLLFVGNPSIRKGFDLLPKVMEELGPDYQLEFTSGKRGIPEDKGLPENMHPLGTLSREDLRDTYRRADVLLFPSRLEGFGYAAVEAMACGTPVVGVKGTTLPEIMPPPMHHCLACKHDPKEIAKIVRRELGRSKASTVWRDWAVSQFSLQRFGAAYRELFREMMKRPGSG
jgi:glycosyltransferase involved in cell wall biosynthesis